MDILITGATGYIGSWLTRYYLKKGYHVIAHGSSNESINKLKEKLNLSHDAKIDFWNQDFLKNEWNFPEINKIDVIIHCAAATKVREGILENYDRYFSLNVLATEKIAIKALESNIQHFIYISTGQVFGTPPFFPIHEKMEKNPINLYGYTKLIGEMVIKSLGYMGLNYTIFRPFSVYGKEQNNIISIINNRLLNREKLIIYGNGNQKRAFTHINDLCKVLDLIIINDNCYFQEYNFSGLKEYTINQLIKMISNKLEVIPSVEYKVSEVDELERNIANTNKIQALGFKFGKTLENFIENELT